MTVYKKIYLDTAPIIYFLERIEPQFNIVRDIIYRHIENDAEFFTSTVTNMEYLVLPLREHAAIKISNFEAFKRLLKIRVLPVDDVISTRAAHIKADYAGIKGMDAVHIATCICANCDAFITNDKQLKQISEINSIFLS